MTPREKEVAVFLERLVHNRFNMDTLNAKLSEYFKEDITAEFVDEENEAGLCDWNLMFNSEKKETYGYFDIYVLKMRNTGFDGAEFLVTEVAYEFDGGED